MTSDFFPLMRGTRQGCLQSSSLFAAANIHKVSLYADDIVLYIKNPENSLPHLYNTIEQFGKYSGYKINYNKSNACLLHMNPTEKMQKSLFQWSPEGFKYPGIRFTPQLNDLFKNNSIPHTNEINADLGRWAKLPLSLLGRINVIRMNILPRLNFLFQTLPCYLSTIFFFNILNNHISKFIWSNKKSKD